MQQSDRLDDWLRELTHERASERRFGRRSAAIRLLAKAMGRWIVAILAVIGSLVVLGALVDALIA